MSFWEELRPASFRGVGFYVDTAERSGGRRGVQHEYPRRQRPYFEDLGRKARTYPVEAYLLGDDVFDQRDALVAALEEAGGGRLTHPYIGTVQVACTDYRESWTKGRGRYCRVSITFVDAGDNRVPTARADTAQRLRGNADDAIDEVTQAFGQDFSTDGQPQFVKDDSAGWLEEQLQPLEDIYGRVPVDDIQQAASFAQRASGVIQRAPQLVDDPLQLAGEVTGLMGDMTGLLGGQAAGVLQEIAAGAQTTLGYADFAWDTLTGARSTLLRNRMALDDLFRRTALAEESRAFANTPFGPSSADLQAAPADAEPVATSAAADSGSATGTGQSPFEAIRGPLSRSGGTVYVATQEDAETLRDDLADRLDDELERLGGAGGRTFRDPTYQAFERLRVGVMRDAEARAADLARVRHIETRATQPSLALANRVYGDTPGRLLAGEAAIVARNRLAKPGFVPGSERLQVVVTEDLTQQATGARGPNG